MRRLLIASVLSVVAIAGVMAAPVTAQAHWRNAHRFMHHAWDRGTSYYPYYAFSDEWRYWPV
jgi:hypothetical protein